MVALWGGSDISSSNFEEEENVEIANLYFMAQNDEVTSVAQVASQEEGELGLLRN